MTIRIEKKVEISPGVQVTVKELTVAEVRAWLKEFEDEKPVADLACDALFEECSLTDLVRMSDQGLAALTQMTESQIAQIIAAAKELNPRFFAMRARLYAAAERVLQRGLPV